MFIVSISFNKASAARPRWADLRTLIEEVWSPLAFFFHPERYGLVSFYKAAIYKKFTVQ